MKTSKQEMFRFVTLRQAESVTPNVVDRKYFRDPRLPIDAPDREAYRNATDYPENLAAALTYRASNANYLYENQVATKLPVEIIQYLQRAIQPGVLVDDIKDKISGAFTTLEVANFNQSVYVNNNLKPFLGNLWDSLYTNVIIAGNEFVETNYLIDALRAMHILHLAVRHINEVVPEWTGGTFYDYDPLLELDIVTEPKVSGNCDPKDPLVRIDPQVKTDKEAEITSLVQQVVQTEMAIADLEWMVAEGDFIPTMTEAEEVVILPDSLAALDPETVALLTQEQIDKKPVEAIFKSLKNRHRRTLQKLSKVAGMEVETKVRHKIAAFMQEYETENRDLRTYHQPGENEVKDILCECNFFENLQVGCIKPLFIGDLIKVEQDLLRYEKGEIAEIQNILLGEHREMSVRELDRVTTTSESETSSESEDSTTTSTDERFQLSSEAQKSSSQNFSISGGLTVSADLGKVQVGLSANASYNSSRSNSSSSSQEYAKNVTETAVKRIRESVRKLNRRTVLTEKQTNTLHGFDNRDGTGPVIGIYRWLEKVYRAQLVNYGKRVMIEFNVPEPAFFYRNISKTLEEASTADLKKPIHPANLKPGQYRGGLSVLNNPAINSAKDIDEDNYLRIAAEYEVFDVNPPIPRFTIFGKAYAFPSEGTAEDAPDLALAEAQDKRQALAEGAIAIPDGYKILQWGAWVPVDDAYLRATGMGWSEGGNRDIDSAFLTVGNKKLVYKAQDLSSSPPEVAVTNFNNWLTFTNHDIRYEGRPIPVSLLMDFEGYFHFNLMFRLERTEEAYAAWQIETYEKIMQGYNNKLAAYKLELEEAKRQAANASPTQAKKIRPDQYRSIELTELKKHCLALLTNKSATGRTSVAETNGQLEIINSYAEGRTIDNWRSPFANGVIAQFFEEVFEWEQTTYEFYPYYWTDRERWENLVNSEMKADPLFEKFLQAGSSKVVVPVRPNYEEPFMFYMLTGLVWGGGKIPAIEDPAYLAMLEELKGAEQLSLDNGNEEGDPWIVNAPTNLIVLNDFPDANLPDFEDTTPPDPEVVEIEDPADIVSA